MKKRIARILVYFLLAGVTALVISHPYVWQSIFGPTVKGEPLWAWQEEFRSRKWDNGPTTYWGKVLNALKLDSRSISWFGTFPREDAEMLPVLLSLADDGDADIR